MRLEQILFEKLQETIRYEVADPDLETVRIISVTLSVDGGHARIGYVAATALSKEREEYRKTKHALERATGFLRARIATQLDLKRVPGLTFTFVGIAEPVEDGSDDQGGGEWPE